MTRTVEDFPVLRTRSEAEQAIRDLVDINRATAIQLVEVGGIDDRRARQIVHYRKKYGPFETVDDLQRLPLFEPADVAKLRGKLKAGRA